MQMLRNGHSRVLRPTAGLAFAIGTALAITVTAGAADGHDHAGAAALRAQLQALLPPTPRLPQSPASTLPVSSCADDNGSGTLRAVVATAGEGDTVDLSALACSSITLSQGAVPVLLNNLTIVGPGADRLALDGAGADRVLLHPGGGALTLRQVTVRNGASRVAGNKVTGGGCVASAGYVVLDRSVVTGCYASGEGVYGGGIFAYGLFAYTSTISANVGRGNSPLSGTATFGGGAYVSSLVLVDSSVSANRADRAAIVQSSYEIGGGVFTNRGGHIERSTLDGNYSRGFGGGVSAFGGMLDVVDSTVSGNASKTACGGGLDVRAFSAGSLQNSTVADNAAASGGGVCLRGGTGGFVLQSTIVSGNSAGSGADIDATSALALTGANNLVGSAGAAVGLPPGTLHADPLLRPLSANGGPTRTRALAPGSPALDAGNNFAALVTDQRGFARTVGSGTDIGAFEGVVQAPAAVQVPALSRAVLAALTALLLLLGAVAARLRKNASFFTCLSPRRRHSSHT